MFAKDLQPRFSIWKAAILNDTNSVAANCNQIAAMLQLGSYKDIISFVV